MKTTSKYILFSLLCLLGQGLYAEDSTQTLHQEPGDSASQSTTSRPTAEGESKLNQAKKEVLEKRVQKARAGIDDYASKLSKSLMENIYDPREIANLLENKGGLIAAVFDQEIAGKFDEDMENYESETNVALRTELAALYMEEEWLFSKDVAIKVAEQLREEAKKSGDKRLENLAETLEKWAQEDSYAARVFQGVADDMRKNQIEHPQCISCGEVATGEDGPKLPAFNPESSLPADQINTFEYNRWYFSQNGSLSGIGWEEISPQKDKSRPAKFNGQFATLPDGKTALVKIAADGSLQAKYRNGDSNIVAPDLERALGDYYQKSKDKLGDKGFDDFLAKITPSQKKGIQKALASPPTQRGTTTAQRLHDVEEERRALEMVRNHQGPAFDMTAAMRSHPGAFNVHGPVSNPKGVFDEQMSALGLDGYVKYLNNHFQSGSKYGVDIDWQEINALWPKKAQEYQKVVSALQAVQKAGIQPFKVTQGNAGFCLWCNLTQHRESRDQFTALQNKLKNGDAKTYYAK